ncbi:MAG: SET domain-containing protein-lysine N-methyltransferase [Gammaproteobacteria bacterium]|nr:SET domain-containing protein-lysine N-methyltransferase [Gammaproteobacteria bacterium]
MPATNTRRASARRDRTSATRATEKTNKKANVRRVAAVRGSRYATSPLIETRRSRIHGLGVYAIAPIKKGTRIIEYLGERISHAEADRRYARKANDDGHTFLFIASSRTVIDASVNGNDARFINHSCDPNCEAVIERGRVYIEAIRDIEPGEELGYDYQLTWESTDDPEDLALYACRCGAKNCRGTMLDKEPVDKQKVKQKAKRKSKRKT